MGKTLLRLAQKLRAMKFKLDAAEFKFRALEFFTTSHLVKHISYIRTTTAQAIETTSPLVHKNRHLPRYFAHYGEPFSDTHVFTSKTLQKEIRNAQNISFCKEDNSNLKKKTPQLQGTLTLGRQITFLISIFNIFATKISIY